MTSWHCVTWKPGAVVAALALAFAPAARAQSTSIQQSEQILSPAGETVEHDSFGSAVAMDGNRMAIGGFNADGNEVGAGAAFVFERMANGWVQTARLFAADGHAEPVAGMPGKFRSDSFGLTIAMSGDTIVVGAPQHNHTGQQANAGAVYVFQLVKGTWVQQAELFSPFPQGQDNFGQGDGFGGIGISGDTVVVTDQGNSIRLPGAVDVFVRTNGVWTFSTQLLVPDDPFFLPSSVAIDGNTVAVGSSISDAPTAFEAGAAYVFRFTGGEWSAPVTVAADDATPFAQFGSSVSLRNNLLAVGAITAPGATAQSGAAYVFSSEGDVWTQQAKLSADDGADFDNFGVSIAVSGQTVIVGATGHTPPTSGAPFTGAAYVFRQQDGLWLSVAELAASDGILAGDYGISVAVFDNTVLVGADLQHPPVEGYPGGEAYVYKLKF
jgi:hypothetical protein